ncbi:MAG: hypothetical protein NW214_05540 [Pseudanabaenaceae cyanobacterium bins.39]|nr:hypothetical protein [Pseudanabaenaceae cyanobacterium bins.39]
MRIGKWRSIVIVAIIITIAIVLLQQTSAINAIVAGLRPKGQQIITVSDRPPKEADDLFTAFVYMPILDYRRDVDSRTVRGLCARQYEIGIGYQDVFQLFTEYKDAACQGDLAAMPNPTILSTNTVKSEIKGEYTRRECDAFDQISAGSRPRNRIEILSKLNQDGQWQKIADNSRRALIGYLRIYCPIRESPNISK